MRRAAARKGDRIVGNDIHLVLEQVGSVITQKQLSLAFDGIIDGSLSSNVKINGKPAATRSSTAGNTPRHETRLQPNQSFPAPPSNSGKIAGGSGTVRINGQPAARANDAAETCRDFAGASPEVVVIGQPSVFIG
jgi:uncharacterized Zn-binding protein involved in type VI secretion